MLPSYAKAQISALERRQSLQVERICRGWRLRPAAETLVVKNGLPQTKANILAEPAVGATAVLLHPPLHLGGVSIRMERGCHRNDSLADG